MKFIEELCVDAIASLCSRSVQDSLSSPFLGRNCYFTEVNDFINEIFGKRN